MRVQADLFRSLQPGLLRGLSWPASAVVRLWELDRYIQAELPRKKFAAMIMGFTTRRRLGWIGRCGRSGRAARSGREL